jgi:hypothetical protein
METRRGSPELTYPLERKRLVRAPAPLVQLGVHLSPRFIQENELASTAASFTTYLLLMSSLSTGLRSMIGVPSTASSWRTRTRRPSVAVISTRCRPMGLGR